MIGLVQRVKRAKVVVIDEHGHEDLTGKIEAGILLLVGFEKHDTLTHVEKLAKKVANMRIFPDSNDKMNLSLADINGELLLVSQFTLVADTTKGNRPGFSNSAPPELGEKLYHQFIAHFNTTYAPCQSGCFGANMQIELINDGPATFYLSI